ncbi:unnamed protein product, partial [Discosporangium mesarthrocarpum]
VQREQKDHSSPVTFECQAQHELDSGGGTLLLGVLLADMTGTMLTLEGIHSGAPAECYYPTAFVMEVL